MKTLVLDIETKPHLVWKWDLFDKQVVNNDMVVTPGGMICFAAKWAGEHSEPVFYSVFHDGEPEMLAQAWELLTAADATVTYNGDKFDTPRLNRAFSVYGFRPPAPYKRIDLYKAVRKVFAFPSYKLDYVCRELEIGSKVQHEGFGLWRQVMADDIGAWERMKEYNIHDVELTEDLFKVLLPWIPDLPSYGAEAGSDICPACGSDDLRKEGHAYTKTGRYQRYVCRSCDTWSRATRRDQGTGITQVAA